MEHQVRKDLAVPLSTGRRDTSQGFDACIHGDHRSRSHGLFDLFDMGIKSIRRDTSNGNRFLLLLE